MKQTTLALTCLLLLAAGLQAQNLKTPAPSPGSTLKQDFALSSIEVSYSRPAMKGRAIFGSLVPFGKVWRTGANQATTITFGEDVSFGGTKVPAGKYGLLTIPGETEWTIILTHQLDVTSPTMYKEDQDVVRYKAEVQRLPFNVESFTILVNDVLPTSCTLALMWDNVYVEVPITADIDKQVMANIETSMKGPKPPYFSAAMYYMETNRDPKQALEWFTKAAEQSPDAYYIIYQKANCLAVLGRKAEAIATAKESMEKAQKAGNPDYVKLNEDLLKKLGQ